MGPRSAAAPNTGGRKTHHQLVNMHVVSVVIKELVCGWFRTSVQSEGHSEVIVIFLMEASLIPNPKCVINHICMKILLLIIMIIVSLPVFLSFKWLLQVALWPPLSSPSLEGFASEQLQVKSEDVSTSFFCTSPLI